MSPEEVTSRPRQDNVIHHRCLLQASTSTLMLVLLTSSGLMTQTCLAQGALTPNGASGLPQPTFHWDPNSGVAPDGSPLPPNYRNNSYQHHHANNHHNGGGQSSNAMQIQNYQPSSSFSPSAPQMQQTVNNIRSQLNSGQNSPNYGSNYYPQGGYGGPQFQQGFRGGGGGRHHRHNQGRHQSRQFASGGGGGNYNQQYNYSRNLSEQQHQLGLQNSAMELERQLQAPPNYMNGIKLVPQGTNLYVRNYETFHSWNDDRQNAIPMVAVPQKLEDSQQHAQHPPRKTTNTANQTPQDAPSPDN